MISFPESLYFTSENSSNGCKKLKSDEKERKSRVLQKIENSHPFNFFLNKVILASITFTSSPCYFMHFKKPLGKLEGQKRNLSLLFDTFHDKSLFCYIGITY